MSASMAPITVPPDARGKGESAGTAAPEPIRERRAHRSAWQSFVEANRRICHGHLQPRLYAVSHMTALMWWFGHHVPRQSRPGTLLEFGCGREFPITRSLGHHFETRYATDIESPDERLIPEGVEFRPCAPAAPLPFPTGSMDAVVIRSVLEHVADPAATFAEIGRVVAPGGRVFLNLPNKWDYVSVLARLAGRFKSGVLRNVTRITWDDFPVYYRCNTRRALRKSIAGSGLTIELFRPWPSEPSYLKFFVPFYVAGAIYQFAISLLSIDALQPSFVVILRKEPADGGGR